MNEMIEQVARALCCRFGENPDREISHITMRPNGVFDVEKERFWVTRIEEARAAISAMRDPTPAMREAMIVAWGDHDPDPLYLRQWQNAIDAALKD